MKHKTREFEKIMREIIDVIYSTNKLPPNCCDKYPEQLAECIERKFIRGVSVTSSMSNALHFTIANPVVTYKGLEFLENKHPDLKSNITLAASIVAIVLSALSVAVAFFSAYTDIAESFRILFG